MKRPTRSPTATSAKHARKSARKPGTRLTARSATSTTKPRATKAPAARGRAAAGAAKRLANKPASPAAAPAALPELHWVETLRDGTHVVIRPIRSADAALERRFIGQLSPESRRMRFLGQLKEPSDALIRQFTDIDYQRDMAFIALVHRDGETREIGVSRFSLGADGTTCECAVTVSDDWHHKGLATLLMRHLITVARARGIRAMISYDAVENTDMRDLAGFLGFARIADPDDPHMVIHRLALQ